MNAPSDAMQFDPRAVTRPDPTLLRYYVYVSLLTVVGFPFVFIPLWFKYLTLTYRFDDEGVSMSWGVLFKKEVVLTYRRIQDIHVTRNLLHRWLGLAAVAVQTASGSAGAEMTIEGVRQADELRDFLYRQMRGARGLAPEQAPASGTRTAPDPTPGIATPSPDDEALMLLSDIRDSLREIVVRGGRAEP